MRLSNRAQVIQESAIRKLDGFVAGAPEVMFHKMNIGQPDVETPATVMAALSRADSGVLAYGVARRTPEMSDARQSVQSRSTSNENGSSSITGCVKRPVATACANMRSISRRWPPSALAL